MTILSLLGVVLAGALLGVEVWVVGIWLLAQLVAATDVSLRRALMTGVELALSALGYVGAAVLIALAAGA